MVVGSGLQFFGVAASAIRWVSVSGIHRQAVRRRQRSKVGGWLQKTTSWEGVLVWWEFEKDVSATVALGRGLSGIVGL